MLSIQILISHQGKNLLSQLWNRLVNFLIYFYLFEYQMNYVMWDISYSNDKQTSHRYYLLEQLCSHWGAYCCDLY